MEDINLSTSSYLAMSDDDGGDSSSGQVQSFKEMASEVRSNDDDDDVGPKDDDELLGNPTSMIESVKAKQAEKAAGKKKTKQQPVKYSWTTEAVDALIREWEVRPNLFDSSHKEYHLKDKRKITVEQIRRKLESDDQIDPAPSDDDIVKKMHNLRTYCNAERNKDLGMAVEGHLFTYVEKSKSSVHFLLI